VLGGDRDLLLLRLIAAVALDNSDVAIESARAVTRYIQNDLYQARNNDYPLSPAGVDAITRNLDSIIGYMQGDLPDGDPARASIVLEMALETRADLERYSAALTQ
jgi:hypothetical protein